MPPRGDQFLLRFAALAASTHLDAARLAAGGDKNFPFPKAMPRSGNALGGVVAANSAAVHTDARIFRRGGDELAACHGVCARLRFAAKGASARMGKVIVHPIAKNMSRRRDGAGLLFVTERANARFHPVLFARSGNGNRPFAEFVLQRGNRAALFFITKRANARFFSVLLTGSGNGNRPVAEFVLQRGNRAAFFFVTIHADARFSTVFSARSGNRNFPFAKTMCFQRGNRGSLNSHSPKLCVSKEGIGAVSIFPQAEQTRRITPATPQDAG